MFGLYDKYVLPKVCNCFMNTKPVNYQRKKIVPNAKGLVLEVGIGSGSNIPFYDKNKVTKVKIGFKNSDPIGLNGKKLSPAKLLKKLNQLAGKNGIGRVDLGENRFIGIKSRGIYETPGGSLLLVAHRAIESVTLDKETMHKKDMIMPRYAELILSLIHI